MKLLLNEQEVRDGCCVATAVVFDCEPDETVVDLLFDKHIGFRANGREESGSGRVVHLDEDRIKNGIATFLTDYHSFNPDNMVIRLNFTEGQGVWAEVGIGEEI